MGVRVGTARRPWQAWAWALVQLGDCGKRGLGKSEATTTGIGLGAVRRPHLISVKVVVSAACTAAELAAATISHKSCRTSALLARVDITCLSRASVALVPL